MVAGTAHAGMRFNYTEDGYVLSITLSPASFPKVDVGISPSLVIFCSPFVATDAFDFQILSEDAKVNVIGTVRTGGESQSDTAHRTRLGRVDLGLHGISLSSDRLWPSCVSRLFPAHGRTCMDVLRLLLFLYCVASMLMLMRTHTLNSEQGKHVCDVDTYV